MYTLKLPTIGIITALPKEYTSVEILLENTKEIIIPNRNSDRRYLLGEVPILQGGKHTVVLALLPHIGTTMAGLWAVHMLDDFPSVQDIIMVGIAGGVPYPENQDEHVRLGDIVVSGEYGVFQFDFVKETIYERTPRPFPRPPSRSLLQSVKLLQAAEIKGERPWLRFIDQATSRLHISRPPAETDVLVSSTAPQQTIPHPEDKKRHPDRPRVFTGRIGASNTLLKNPQLRDKLRDQYNIKAIEMESSGIADATWNDKAGYLVIRGICDYCDTNKSDAWQEYAAIVAAAYTRALLASIPHTVPDNAGGNNGSNRGPSRQTIAIEDAQRKLAQLPLNTIPEVAALPLGSRMPFSHNPHFVGRSTVLQTLAPALKGGESVIIEQVETAAATGMGGIGKTQLASEFMHRYGQYFAGGVFWLNFADANNVQNEVADCSTMVDLETYSNFASLPLNEKVRLVRSALQSPLPRLLVFDNCENVQLLNYWRPRTGGCRILITSLRRNWPSDLGMKALPLDCLGRDESLQLLCKYRDDLSVDNPVLNAIADELGDLPLALHLAGKFLERYRHANVGIPEVYLAKLREVTPLRHRSLKGEGVTTTTNHIEHIERTFALAYEQLETQDPIDQQACRLLARVQYFAPGFPIPRDILLRSLGETNDNADMEILAEDAVERLLSLGLLESSEDGVLRVHRLITEFIEIQIGTEIEAQTEVEQVVFLVAKYLNILGYPKYILALQPHLRRVTDLAKPRGDVMAAQLCNALAYFFIKAGAFNEARVYSEHALEISKQNPGQDQADNVNFLNNLAEICQAQGDNKLAKYYVQQALEIGERAFGSEHLLITDCLNILAKLYANADEPKQAEKLIRRALGIRKRLLEADDPDIAIELNYLGHVLQIQKVYSKAEEHFQQAWSIFKKHSRENSPKIAECLINLAALYLEQRRFKESQQFYMDGMQIYEKEWGANHFEVALSLDGLAECYRAQSKYDEAEPLYERALAILEHNSSVESRFIIQILTHLVSNYVSQGNFDLAESLLLKTVDRRKGIFVLTDATLAQSLEYVAGGYKHLKKYTKAAVLFLKALLIYEQVRGPGHPDTVRAESLLKETKQKAEENRR